MLKCFWTWSLKTGSPSGISGSRPSSLGQKISTGEFAIASLTPGNLKEVEARAEAFEKRATGNRSVVRVGIAHVESRRYEAAQLSTDAKYQLISAWIAGECYCAPAQEAADLKTMDSGIARSEPADHSTARTLPAKKTT
jgi:hypothetical protein